MRVLQIPEWYPSQQRPHAGIFNREIAQAAASSLESEVLIIDIVKDLPFRKIELNVVENGVRETYLRIGASPVPGTTRFILQHLYNRAIDEYINRFGKPDVIHTQDLMAYRVVNSTLVTKNSIPVLVSQHWSALARKKLTSRQLKQYELTFKKAAFILPAMKTADVEYRKLGLFGNIEWLPNVLDTQIFSVQNDIQKLDHIVHISGFTDVKRVEDILMAFKKLLQVSSQVKLILIGDGAQRSKYETMAGEMLPTETYEFKGFLDRESIARELNSAKCFVFPSTYETFGCVLMEAAACGCPIVSTRVGGIAYVLDENEAIFVEPGDVDAITRGMQLCIEERYPADTASVADHMKSKFSKEQIGLKLKELYTRAIEMSA